MWFIFIFILWSSIGISHIAFSSNLTCVLIFYSWRLFELFKGEKKSRGKQIEVHWRHQHKFWSIIPHIEGWCVAKPLIVLHNAFLLYINWYLLDVGHWFFVQSLRHWFFDVGHFSKSWGPLSILCAETTWSLAYVFLNVKSSSLFYTGKGLNMMPDQWKVCRRVQLQYY